MRGRSSYPLTIGRWWFRLRSAPSQAFASAAALSGQSQRHPEVAHGSSTGRHCRFLQNMHQASSAGVTGEAHFVGPGCITPVRCWSIESGGIQERKSLMPAGHTDRVES